MHRLPVASSTALLLDNPSSSRDCAADAHSSARFRTRDYLRYGAKLASGMLSSRIFGRHCPLMVNIEPTHRCNLDCAYCDKVDPKSPQMQTDAALHMIDELADIGTLSVYFDGGEPLFHPGIESFVRRAKSHGMRVSMSTNGHLIKRKSQVLSFVDMLKISIDGPRHVHDAGRGSGSFDQALQGARLAIEAGSKVAIRMTLASRLPSDPTVACFPADAPGEICPRRMSLR